MFGLGPDELILALLLILVLFGSRKVPKVTRGLGEGVKELKKASRDDHSPSGRA